MKIHGLINMTSQQLARIALSDGKTSDHSDKATRALLLGEAWKSVLDVDSIITATCVPAITPAL